MKIYAKYVQCADCGRKIPICNAHYINGKPYGYSCYKKQLALLYKQWEDEKNAEYSAKCFAAMQIFEGKKNNSFHDSICKQWNDCRKLTAKQLDCIINGFTQSETFDFWFIWQELSNDDCTKRSIGSWLYNEIAKNHAFGQYMENEKVLNCLLYMYEFRSGFHFLRDIDDPLEPDMIFIMENGKNNKYLKEHMKDEYLEVLKVVEGIRK